MMEKVVQSYIYMAVDIMTTTARWAMAVKIKPLSYLRHCHGRCGSLKLV